MSNCFFDWIDGNDFAIDVAMDANSLSFDGAPGSCPVHHQSIPSALFLSIVKA